MKPTRRALLAAALVGSCATSEPRPALLGRWRQTQTRATFTFRDGGVVEERDADGYPPPPPVHTTWTLIWRARADGDFDLAYDGLPDHVVAIAHVSGRRMELRYSARNVHVLECIPPADPIVGRWLDRRSGNGYTFLDDGRARFSAYQPPGADPELSAVFVPDVSWRRLNNRTYEITLRTQGLHGGVFVDRGTAHIIGTTLQSDIRQAKGMLTLERII